MACSLRQNTCSKISFTDPHLLVSEEDIVEGNIDDLVNETLPHDQLKKVERPPTVFVEQKGVHNGYQITCVFMLLDSSGKRFTECKREELNVPVIRSDTILPVTIVSTTQLCMVCYIYIYIYIITNYDIRFNMYKHCHKCNMEKIARGHG